MLPPDRKDPAIFTREIQPPLALCLQVAPFLHGLPFWHLDLGSDAEALRAAVVAGRLDFGDFGLATGSPADEADPVVIAGRHYGFISNTDG
jgi:hypothetical protein